MNNKIDKLLQLYFDGESSLEQEEELKKYFLSDEVADEHKEFTMLFHFFDSQKQIKMEYTFTPPKREQKNIRFLWIAGAAASIFIALLLMFTPSNDTYMLVNGESIYDVDMIMYQAEIELNKVTEKLISSLEPMKRVDRNLESAMQQIKNIEESIIEKPIDK